MGEFQTPPPLRTHRKILRALQKRTTIAACLAYALKALRRGLHLIKLKSPYLREKNKTKQKKKDNIGSTCSTPTIQAAQNSFERKKKKEDSIMCGEAHVGAAMSLLKVISWRKLLGIIFKFK